MSEKQITITVSGPKQTGKTYLMEKIFAMLKAEGIEASVDCLDADFGKYEKWKQLDVPVPTLKKTIENSNTKISLREISTYENYETFATSSGNQTKGML